MNIIKKDITNELVIKNSKFICVIKYVEDENDIKETLKNYRKEYKDATHVTYGYRLINKQKYSDDNEPGGTAGAPIMDVILKNDLINILVIVIRYFGGIKLGAGGLIRAYSKSVREALLKTEINEYIKYNYYEISTNYDNLKLLNTLTQNLNIINKTFKEEIIYIIKIEDNKDNINNINNTNIKIRKLNK